MRHTFFNQVTLLRASLILLMVLTLLTAPVAIAAASTNFRDLPGNDPIYPYIKHLSNKNIMTGFNDGTYRPGNSITRAEMAVILCKTKGLKVAKPTHSDFADLNKNYWAYPYIEAVTKAGIYTGYSDKTFRPQSYVSRAEVAILLIKLSSQELTPVDIPGGLSDVSANHWAYSYIAAALDAGIIEKTTADSFNPKRPATRAQVARGLAMTLNLAPDFTNMSISPILSPVKGKVSLISAKGKKQEVTGEVKCSVGDTIKTGNSEALLDFPDGSGLLLATDTEITIIKSQGQSYIKNDGSQGIMVDGLEIKLSQGRIFGALAADYFINQGSDSVTKGLANNKKGSLSWWKKTYTKRERMKVNMPWGVAAVRGTIFSCNSNKELNSDSVLDGRTQFSFKGKTILVESNQDNYVAINSAGATTAFGIMPEFEKAQWAKHKWWVLRILERMRANIPLYTGPWFNSSIVFEEILSKIYDTLEDLGSPESFPNNEDDQGGGGNDHSISRSATLSKLTASIGNLSPDFSPEKLEYTLNVPNTVETIKITPTVNRRDATVTIDGKKVVYGDSSGPISLTAGVPRDILVVVMSKNGSNTTYKITAIRATAGGSSDSSLSSLTVSGGTLAPVFTPATYTYTLSVPNATATIMVTPTVNESNATVKVQGISVNSGRPSQAISLTAGVPKDIKVLVTAQNGSNTTYTITATRAAALSDDSSLSSLTVSAGTLTPGFTSGNHNYTLSVPNANATITVTPTVNENHAAVTVQGMSVTSGNPSQAITLPVNESLDIGVVVTAQNTSQTTYTITATRAAAGGSNDASLTSLTSSAGTWLASFDPNTLEYQIRVESTDTGLTVVPTVNESHATVTVNGLPVTSGNPSAPITLNEPEVPLKIPVKITAQNGTTSTYTLTFTVYGDYHLVSDWGSYYSLYGYPSAVVRDSSGNIYLNDEENKRILVFNASGNYLRLWDADAASLAIDAADNIYWVESDTYYFYKCDTSGNVLGGPWGGESQFESAQRIAVDNSGRIYVTDQYGNGIWRLNSDNTFTRFGTTGTGNGQLKGPYSIAIDSDGTIYVGEYGNHRVQWFDQDLNYLGKIDNIWAAEGIAVKDGNLYVTTDNDVIEQYSISDTNATLLQTYGSSGSGDGQLDYPRGVAVDSGGNVYVADFRNNRMQKYDASGNNTMTISLAQADPPSLSKFNGPGQVAVTPSGSILIVDTENYRIQEFDSDGNFIRTWGSKGNTAGKFEDSLWLAADSGGNIYVTDYWNNRVQKFDASGGYLTEWTLSEPKGIAIDSANHIYVCRGTGDIQKFDTSGTLISEFEDGGKGPIAVDSDGYIYVVGGRVINKLASDGTIVTSWGNLGSWGEASPITGLATDTAGHVFVVNAADNRILKFSSTGILLAIIGESDGLEPSGVAVNSSGDVYISDSGNDRMTKYARS
ncbi:MAG: cadherin-like beta sandwich domain-containing protein [Chitinophagales bacterium]